MSARRDDLKKYLGKEDDFIAIVHLVNISKFKTDLILDDVSVAVGDDYQIVSKHLHGHNVDRNELKRLKRGDIIIFRGSAYGYTRKGECIKCKNFSLGQVKNIMKVGGKYNG